MEYIPDGFTKDQWRMLKEKEAADLKAKGNLGALGTTKFKSRSFEAWQKAGGKHLFPADPRTTPYEERPYMQRKDGDWEGNDLKKKGLSGKGQGAASKRLSIDNLYDNFEKEGKLNSASLFGSGQGLPWAGVKPESKKGAFNPDAKLYANRGVAGGQKSPEEIARMKAQLVKPVVTKKTEPAAAAAVGEKKKGFFGLF